MFLSQQDSGRSLGELAERLSVFGNELLNSAKVDFGF